MVNFPVIIIFGFPDDFTPPIVLAGARRWLLPRAA
jgi:hypothetical protein